MKTNSGIIEIDRGIGIDHKEIIYGLVMSDNEKLDFGDAIKLMVLGAWVKLPHWSEDVYISIQFPTDDSKMSAPYFYVTSRYGCVPWIPTMIEMLSNDWIKI